MPNPIHTHKYAVFRELLIDIRQSKGLLQSEVAAKLGKPQSFISKYERGERRLDFPEFLELAAALEIDVPEFIAQYKQAVNHET
jgi:transcriptional regulator with XRE-family HTH domain